MSARRHIVHRGDPQQRSGTPRQASLVKRPRLGCRRGSALVSALATLALAGVAAAALAELGRVALIRARLDRDGVSAWFLAEAGLADTVAAIAPGRDFTPLLTTPTPLASGPSTPWAYTASFRDDVDDQPNDPAVDVNERVILRITATGPAPVRRRLEAVIGRETEPFLPGAVTLAGPPGDLGGDLVLDGHDFTMGSSCAAPGAGLAKVGLALPENAALPEFDHPERIIGRDGSPSVARVAAPNIAPLADVPGAVRHPAGTVAGDLGNAAAPQLTVIEGDALVEGPVSGAGVLYIAGRLNISGTLVFTGVVAAAGGVDLTGTGEINVCGGLWAAGERALDARGRGTVRASADAIRLAADLSPLPAPARVVAVRELF